MVGGVRSQASPISLKSINETFYDVIDALCNRYIGLSPFEVMNADTRDVYDLYVDVIIHDLKEKNPKEFVTSKNATWY